MIYTFPALVPCFIIGHKADKEVLLFDKTAGICMSCLWALSCRTHLLGTLNVLIADFLDISTKKEPYFRYTLIEYVLEKLFLVELTG
jgi:hypothetical protein